MKPGILIGVETGLGKHLARIALAIETLGERMTELTDRVDAALDAFLANEADEDARLEAAESANALLRAQIDELRAGGAANVESLEKVLAVLEAQVPQQPDA